MTVQLFTNPDAFFERKEGNSSILTAAFVVFVASLMNAAGSFIISQHLLGSLSGQPGSVAMIGAITGSITGVVIVLALWMVYAGVFHLISLYFDGEGSFADLLKLSGWGFVPKIFAGILSTIASYYALQDVAKPEDVEAVQGVAQQIQSDPVLQAASAVGIAFTLWQGFLWVFAVKHARNLSLREAALTVSVPVAATVLWTVYSLL